MSKNPPEVIETLLEQPAQKEKIGVLSFGKGTLSVTINYEEVVLTELEEATIKSSKFYEKIVNEAHKHLNETYDELCVQWLQDNPVSFTQDMLSVTCEKYSVSAVYFQDPTDRIKFLAAPKITTPKISVYDFMGIGRSSTTTRVLTVVDLLQEAKQLLVDPKKLCRGHYAVDRSGVSVDPLSDGATIFCSLGAIIKTTHQRYTRAQFEHAKHLLERAAMRMTPLFNMRKINRPSIPDVNDQMSHEHVMDMWDHAIEEARV